MKSTIKHKISWVAVLALLSGTAWAQVAQSPLLTKTSSVRPNIALILDTSGSMDWECVYAKQVQDAFIAQGLAANNIPGLTTNCLATTDPRQTSPINNLLFYNPKTTYDPGYIGGVRQTNAAVTNSAVVTMFLPKSGQDPTTYTTSAQLSNTNNYDTYGVTTTRFQKNGVNITGTTGASNPFGSHQGRRTDCAGDPCTHAEERQNIANWRAYHLDRLASAKTGVSAAFVNQADAFRLSYANLSSTLTTMTDFSVAKNNFFAWLDGRTANGGTPLRTALNNAGQFYSSSSNSGPWGTRPWSPLSEQAKDHLSCRRSFTILITDGFYNDSNPPSPGNVDGQTGVKQTYAKDNTKTYQYVPGNKTDTRSKGKSDTTSGSGGYSDTLADIAMKYWVTDLRSDLDNDIGKGDMSDPPFWQNMTTYTVSFGAPGRMTEANVASAKAGNLAWIQPVADTYTTIDDMRHAAWNGGGDFLTVTDARAFATKLGNVINSISTQEYSQSGVAASAVTLTAGTKKFIPYYTAGSWWGNVQMVNLSNGSVAWQVIATDTNGQPTGISTFPADLSKRNIHVWVNASTQAIPFLAANVNNTTYNLKGTNPNMQMSTAVTSDIIDFLRGNRSKEGIDFRVRPTILGDIVNSTPAFIKNNTNPQYENLPAGTPGLSTYAAYMKMKAERIEGVLLVGANDGMVHSFGEGAGSLVGGREVFAYVPRSVLGKMEALSLPTYVHNHTYLVDGPLSETDAYVTTPDLNTGAPVTGWRNIVIGTTGAGAKAVYALNATDPLAMNGRSILWEINADPAFPLMPGNSSTSFAELGHVLTHPQSGITPSGDWVTIFGNGYDSKSRQASLFIVNTATGQLIREIKTDLQTSNGLGGIRTVLNSNKQIIGVYAGDLRGRVWKFDLSSSSSSGWKLGNNGAPLFTATDGVAALPITAAPAVLERTDQAGFKPSYLITIATGKLFETSDPGTTTPTQYAFGLWDKQPFGSSIAVAISNADLESLRLVPTTTNNSTNFYKVALTNSSVSEINWTTKLGWKLPLDITAGQRVTYPLGMYGDVVKIDSITPVASTSSCNNSTAVGLSIYLNPLSGMCLSGGSLDTNGDGTIDSSDTESCARTTPADGMDVVLTILNAQGQDSGLYNNQGADGSYDFVGKRFPPPNCTNSAAYAAAHPDECNPKDCSDPTFRLNNPGLCGGGGGTLNRSWRQIFPRAN